ncbi:MAG: ATP-binding protein [Aromatoleum sp.]|jgi:DNA replication protein DnaC|uniref:ATP-binding protein n=1 Tax=Aromatoleum sp. TaxID=2307007 RepID=UPI002895BCF8|nr:ATP-binding protein [Aromatoleum sp.]MDT3668958.1 ATP-binding protein [Aromatoleum sp.]
MRDLIAELKSLRLYGITDAWADLTAQGETTVQGSRWLLEHLLQAEDSDRHERSIAYQLHAAKFPVHRDLAGFDFEQSKVDRELIKDLATLSFTEAAHNVVFIGGTGTGKSQVSIAIRG